MAERRISYTDRDFASLRQDLIDYTQQYYPDLIDNFNDAALFSVFLDLNAAIGDNLNFQIDRSIQETVLQYAQQRSSVYNIARTYGLKIPGNRPSVSLVDFSITVPANGDQENVEYCGILRAGAQVQGGGQVFETVYDIDFSSQYNNEGYVNAKKIPNFDANNNLINYTIVKREVVVNGFTKVFKKVITQNDVRPFFEIFLPEKNVLGVTAVIQKDGTSFQNVPSSSEFITSTNRWYEVDALAEDRVFVEDPTKASDNPGIKVGRYIQTDSRFITEYTPEGYLKMTFGNATVTADEQLAQFARTGVPLNIANYQNNIGLGRTVQPNTTLFIQYRVGGGLASNLGVNALTQLGTYDLQITGPNQTINSSVVNSLSVNNVTAAIGGANQPTINEARNMVAFNFAAQKRAVTINDYNSLLNTMPGKFGAPAKVGIVENNNKIEIQLLSYDSAGKLTSNVPNVLKTNVANYLSNYRMINDYVVINTAEVIDLKYDISVILDSAQNRGEVISNIINVVSNIMSPLYRELGQNVNISELRREIQDVGGVNTVSTIDVFNLVGGQYSSNETSQRYSDATTRQILLIDETIFAQPNQVYQVRIPSKDIQVRVKTLTSTSFS